MAIDRRIGTKVGKHFRKEETAATRVDPYPYIGIVKNNIDPTRAGRLQVWIPDLGGAEEDPKGWRTVSYASPFMGYTSQHTPKGQVPSKANDFTHTVHSYGMWMVPPDIGVEVIVLFIGGDPTRGYWLACTNRNLSRHMMPGLASSFNVDTDTASADLKKSLKPNTRYPVTEFNENNEQNVLRQAFTSNKKPLHEPQFRILTSQGLDRDPVRGTISSSSQRETPSNVFGISTPGRPYDDPADDPNFEKKVQEGKLTEADYAFKTRKGGHTFIMDDGDTRGDNQLVRLRSAGGHQILLHDTDDSIYIGNAQGTVWVELDAEGQLNIFASNNISIRSQGDINLHSDSNVNIEAKKSFRVRAGEKIKLETSIIDLLGTNKINLGTGGGGFDLKSDGAINLDASNTISVLAGGNYYLNAAQILQNSGGAVSVKKPKLIKPTVHNDTVLDDKTGLWVSTSDALNSIVTVATTHEPFRRVRTVLAATTPIGIKAQSEYSGDTDATKTTSGGGGSPLTAADLANQPECDCKIGNLSANEKKALFATIGKSESGGKYDTVNSIGFVGKYQFGWAALQDLGMIKKHVKRNSELNDPNSWIGTDGKPKNLQEFLADTGTQERLMCDLVKRNYNTLTKMGIITEADDAATVGGLLMTAHLLGPGGARDFRNGKGGADAYGTTGATYFNKGKYAIAQSSKLDTTV